MFLMLQYGSNFEANFHSSDENLRIPDLPRLCFFWDQTRPRFYDLNLPCLISYLVSWPTRVWKPFFNEDTQTDMQFYLQTLILYSNFHYCSCGCECVSVFLSILQKCIMHSIILFLFGIASALSA